MEKSIVYTYLKLLLYFLSTKHFLSRNFDACACNPFQAPFLNGAWFEANMYAEDYPFLVGVVATIVFMVIFLVAALVALVVIVAVSE